MEEKVVIMNSSEAKNLNENEYFTAYFNEWDESGRECKASWAVSVKKGYGKVFTIELANKFLSMANEGYKKMFGKDVNFNDVKYDMTDYYEDLDGWTRYTGKKKIGRYNKRKNILRIFVDDLPVYENNNGKICRDATALADSLMH